MFPNLLVCQKWVRTSGQISATHWSTKTSFIILIQSLQSFQRLTNQSECFSSLTNTNRSHDSLTCILLFQHVCYDSDSRGPKNRKSSNCDRLFKGKTGEGKATSLFLESEKVCFRAQQKWSGVAIPCTEEAKLKNLWADKKKWSYIFHSGLRTDKRKGDAQNV